MDWKLQNSHEQRSISQTKPFSRNLLVGNLGKLAKNRQVGLICHISAKRNQETGNKQTDKQTKYCNPRAHARRALIMIVDLHLCELGLLILKACIIILYYAYTPEYWQHHLDHIFSTCIATCQLRKSASI